MRSAAILCAGLLAPGCKKGDDIEKGKDVDPMLTFDSPEAAAWRPAGRVEVSGTCRDVTSVQVNESAMDRGDGRWSGQVELARGVNVVEARAMGADGDELWTRHGVLAGEFGDPSETIERALTLRLNQGGLDDVMALVASLIDQQAIDEAARALNPVYEDSYGIWGWDAVTISADIVQVAFSDPRLAVDPRSGALDLQVVLPDVYVAVNAYGDVVGIGFDTMVSLEAKRAVVEGTLTAEVADGQLHADLSGASVSLEGFTYDTSLLPGDVEAWILVDTIREAIEGMILEQIETMVPELLDETLAGLDPSFETEMLGVAVAIEGGFADVSIDSDGIELVADVDVDVPSTGEMTYAGYLLAGEGEPEVDTEADLGAALSDDLLNRVFFEAWSGGLLEVVLSTSDGSLSPAMLVMLDASEGTIAVSAKLPPVVVERDGGLEAQVGELIVTIDTPDGALGTHLVVAVDAWAAVEPVYEDGKVGFDVGEVTTSLMVRESDWGASNEATTALIEELLPLDTFLVLLGAFAYEVPPLYGLVIESAAVARDDSGVHTGVVAQLGIE